MFDQALEGGGAKNINFQELAADLAMVTYNYPFRIPPYFALIIRAIGETAGCDTGSNTQRSEQSKLSDSSCGNERRAGEIVV